MAQGTTKAIVAMLVKPQPGALPSSAQCTTDVQWCCVRRQDGQGSDSSVPAKAEKGEDGKSKMRSLLVNKSAIS